LGGYTDSRQAKRSPDEEGDYMAFEQLVAEAAMKKDKKESRKNKRYEEKGEMRNVDS
jgi:hypothetical protein